MSDWQLVIGIETHVQLNTRAKLFSTSAAAYCDEPNRQANFLDFGLPGTLPTVNREAVAKAIRFGLAVNAEVAQVSEFARKHYFYPDLPKGYQTSQFEHPIVKGGRVEVAGEKESFSVPLVRAHLEEDAGKLLHDAIPGASAVDLNRAGVPLLEIVSEPTLHSASSARDYAKALHALACWLDICDGNLQEGSMRFDVNVSLRPDQHAPLGVRTETKNLNSFRFIEQAIQHEAARQQELLEAGESVTQETRLFDPDQGVTRPLRSKEEAADYRYMPCPDLLPLRISDDWMQECREAMPELPADCQRRLVAALGLSEYAAGVLAADRDTVAYFEAVASACGEPVTAANWIAGELAALCKEHSVAISAAPVDAPRLASLLGKVIDKTISGKMAKQLLARVWESGEDPLAIIEAEGMRQITDGAELEQTVRKIIADHPDQAQQYREGKERLLGFFVGQAMKATKGQGNPQQLNELLRRLLAQDDA